MRFRLGVNCPQNSSASISDSHISSWILASLSDRGADPNISTDQGIFVHFITSRQWTPSTTYPLGDRYTNRQVLNKMGLLDLPNEAILLMIPQLEYESDINALCRTTRRLHELINPELYKRSVTRRNGGYTLEWAAIHGSTSTGQLILVAGAPPDACGGEEWQPFALAALHGHRDMIELLYAHGVAPCSRSNDWKNHLDDEEGLEDWEEGHPLSMAAAYGHLSVVATLLKYGVYPDLPTGDYEKRTALHLAAEKGHLEVIRVLIDAGCSVDALDGSGANPLAYAAQGGHLDTVRFLLSLGADPNIEIENVGTSLCMASRSSNVDVVRCLIDHGATPNPSYPDGQKPLFQLSRAAEQGDDEIVDLLLAQFDYIKSSTAPYQQAILLCVAALTGRTTLLTDLLTKHNYHPDLRVTDLRVFRPRGAYHPTPTRALLWTAEKDQPAAAEILLKHGASISPPTDAHGEVTPLLHAIKKRHQNVVATLLRHRADPNNPPGQALFDAVNHPSIFQLLLDNGADPTTSLPHRSLMTETLYSGNVDALRILLDHPDGTALIADPLETGPDASGPHTAPLVRCAVSGGEGVLRLLLERSLLTLPADLHTHAASEHLIHATRSGDLPLVRLLLDLGFDTNAGGNAGYLLYRAATVERDPEEMVDVLLQHGCRIDHVDQLDRTALYTASSRGDVAAMRLLLVRGADPRVRSRGGETALSIAAKEAQICAVQILLDAFDRRKIPLPDLDNILKVSEKHALDNHQGDILRVLRQFYWRRRYPVCV